jgi:chromosome segregation ATPase
MDPFLQVGLEGIIERLGGELAAAQAEVERLRDCVNDAEFEATRLRATNAELVEARRNLETRLNAELREAAAEIAHRRRHVAACEKAILEQHAEIERLRAANVELAAENLQMRLLLDGYARLDTKKTAPA